MTIRHEARVDGAPFAMTLQLSRHYFSPRDVARPAALWRACQDVAVSASVAAGWPPARYRQERTAFVVREMTVRHHREGTYGEAISGRTWVSRLRRDILSTRQVRLEARGLPLASATQEWVHVSESLRPQRGSPEMSAAFPILSPDDTVTLPEVTPIEPKRVHRFVFRTWHTWMDPLGHINHPMYIDWIDEATTQLGVQRGFREELLSGEAESGLFRAGVPAGVNVCVESALVGTAPSGAAVLKHRICDADSPLLYAEMLSVRELCGTAPGTLAELVR